MASALVCLILLSLINDHIVLTYNSVCCGRIVLESFCGLIRLCMICSNGVYTVHYNVQNTTFFFINYVLM